MAPTHAHPPRTVWSMFMLWQVKPGAALDKHTTCLTHGLCHLRREYADKYTRGCVGAAELHFTCSDVK